MIDSIKKEIAKVVVGHDELIDAMLIALFSGGHILVEGVPGVAKTTAVKSLASTLGFDFKRVQFTPDLLPGDIIGSEIFDLKNNDFTIKKGPIFTNLLLADEINRASAKVQSALLEAMAERQVTIANKSFKLQSPFMVLATANPIDQEGVYDLPEAQLDRFMLKVNVDYNSFEQELEVVLKVANQAGKKINQIIDKNGFEAIKDKINAVFVDNEVAKYMLKLVFATREPQNYGLDEIKEYIDFGVSPRGSIDLYKASRARAYLNDKEFVTPSDIAQVAFMVLSHRIVLSYKAAEDRVDCRDIIEKIIEKVAAP